MKKITVSALSIIVALAAGSAIANDHGDQNGEHKGEHHGKMFKETDTDGDGAISKSEWQAKGDKMFSEIDANGDGKVTQDEKKAHHEKKRAEWEAKKAEHKDKKEGTVKKGDAAPAEKH